MIGKFYLIFKQSFNHIPDISKGIVCISELCPSDALFFILSFLEDDFSNIESPH